MLTQFKFIQSKCKVSTLICQQFSWYICMNACANKVTLSTTQVASKGSFLLGGNYSNITLLLLFLQWWKELYCFSGISEKCWFEKVTPIFSTNFLFSKYSALVGLLGVMQMFSLATVLKLLSHQKCLWTQCLMKHEWRQWCWVSTGTVSKWKFCKHQWRDLQSL